MHSNLENLRYKLTSLGIARDEDIEGASLSEISDLESIFGRFPNSYREIMLVLGRKAGGLVDDKEFSFYIDQVGILNEKVHDYRAGAINSGERVSELPKGVFFISGRSFDNPCFLLTGETEHSRLRGRTYASL